MSIGARILLVVAMLGLSLSALLTMYAHSAWSDTARAMEQQSLSEVTTQLIAASAALAVGRGLVNGQLADPSKMPDEIKAGIEAGRRAQVASIAAAGLGEHDYQTLQPSLRALDTIRVAFDGAASGRSVTPATSAWFGAATAAVDAIVELRRRIDSRSSTQTQSQLLVSLRDRAAELAEFAGRERGMLNGLIAVSTKANPGQIYALGALSGHIDSAWASDRAGLRGGSLDRA